MLFTYLPLPKPPTAPAIILGLLPWLVIVLGWGAMRGGSLNIMNDVCNVPCSICWFADVRIIYHRECDPLVCPSFNDLEGSWPDNDDPVCASNGFTYGNIHQIRCLHDFQPGELCATQLLLLSSIWLLFSPISPCSDAIELIRSTCNSFASFV